MNFWFSFLIFTFNKEFIIRFQKRVFCSPVFLSIFVDPWPPPLAAISIANLPFYSFKNVIIKINMQIQITNNICIRVIPYSFHT